MVSDVVPTDEGPSGTSVVEYSEEILTHWHKWYSSDSEEDEEDYNEDEEGEGVRGDGPAHRYDGDRYLQESSSSGCDESSDEDYIGLSSQRGRAKGRGRGRGRRRGGEGGGRAFVPSIPSLLSIRDDEAVNHVKTDSRTVPLQAPPKPVIPVPSMADGPSSSLTTIRPSASVPVKPDSKPVKLVKPVKIVSANQAKPVKPPKLVSIVGKGQSLSGKGGPPSVMGQSPSGMGQSPTGSMVALSPGNYYQVQHVPSANFVPLQLVSPVQQNAFQMGSGSLVLVQQPGSQPQYATLQTSVSSPQKVSVIMNPRQVTLATIGSAPSSHGVISQFDGPKGKRKAIDNLNQEFERVRKKARKALTGNDETDDGRKDGPLEKEEEGGGGTSTSGGKGGRRQKTVSEGSTGQSSKRGSGNMAAKTTTKKGKGRPVKEGEGESSTCVPPPPPSGGTDTPKKGGGAGRGRNSFSCPTCQETFPNQRACKTHTETNHLPVSVSHIP